MFRASRENVCASLDWFVQVVDRKMTHMCTRPVEVGAQNRIMCYKLVHPIESTRLLLRTERSLGRAKASYSNIFGVHIRPPSTISHASWAHAADVWECNCMKTDCPRTHVSQKICEWIYRIGWNRHLWESKTYLPFSVFASWSATIEHIPNNVKKFVKIWCLEHLMISPSHEHRPSKIRLMPKTIGKRKGDRAWSCLRWQTQPEKNCKLQCTNQYNMRSGQWFILCKLQIFSGCVYQLKQLHSQSPFLFPLIWVLVWFIFRYRLSTCCPFHPFVRVSAPLLGPLRGRNCRCFWLWQLGFGVPLRAAMSNLSSSPNPLSIRSVLWGGRKHKTVVFSQSNAVRE